MSLRGVRAVCLALLVTAFFLAVALARRGGGERPGSSSLLAWEEIEPARLF